MAFKICINTSSFPNSKWPGTHPFLSEAAMKAVKAHENKWNRFLWKRVHYGGKAGGRQLILKGWRKVQLTRLRSHLTFSGYPEQSAWRCSTFLLFIKSTATESCGGWVGKCESNENITTSPLTPGFNDAQKGGAFVSERQVHESCLKLAFRNVGSTAVDLKQISARNENGFNSNLKRDKWLEKTNPADKSGKSWGAPVSLEIHLEQQGTFSFLWNITQKQTFNGPASFHFRGTASFTADSTASHLCRRMKNNRYWLSQKGLKSQEHVKIFSLRHKILPTRFFPQSHSPKSHHHFKRSQERSWKVAAGAWETRNWDFQLPSRKLPPPPSIGDKLSYPHPARLERPQHPHLTTGFTPGTL